MNIMFPDEDGDGIGTDSSFIESCSEEDGYSLESETVMMTMPMCIQMQKRLVMRLIITNGVVDEGVTLLFFIDNDGDGFGYPTQFVDGCGTPEGIRQFWEIVMIAIPAHFPLH